MLASTSSVPARGAMYDATVMASGSGSALRSTLPLGVSGSASSVTNADGTMYSGSFALSASRSPATVSSTSAVATT